MFLQFFNYLDGHLEFNYDQYISAYNDFTDLILNEHDNIPEFVESKDDFLQFLYDTNIIAYIEKTEDGKTFYRWCYRERSTSNFSPKVKKGQIYKVHYGLLKALNLGFQKTKR
jgi:hypothetical protein